MTTRVAIRVLRNVNGLRAYGEKQPGYRFVTALRALETLRHRRFVRRALEGNCKTPHDPWPTMPGGMRF